MKNYLNDYQNLIFLSTDYSISRLIVAALMKINSPTPNTVHILFNEVLTELLNPFQSVKDKTTLLCSLPLNAGKKSVVQKHVTLVWFFV